MRRACLLLAVLFACAAPGPPPPATPTPVADLTPPPPAPQLPPGVLAEARGVHGVVRVEEQGDLRLLTVDGVVQGAAPLLGDPLTGDPLVALLHAARPEARRALVIGLGTGRTAAELAALGLEVEAVDIEPAVIDFAKKYFGYTGDAAVADGFAHAKGRADTYDIILVDTLATAAPHELADLYERLGIDTATGRVLLGARLRGSPADPLLLAAARRVRYLQLWGAGVGDEAQTLYALLSPKPSNILAPADIPAWPLPIRFDRHELPTTTAVADAPTARRVVVLGYLLRANEDSALSLDLPHQEMGALRYRLHGPALAQLEPLLPPKFVAMTDGDIVYDGDTAGTMRDLLGGGGVKRSDVRFSPVIVGLTGVARVAAVIEPDAAPRVPPELRGAARTDPRLPYGGTLYDLDVETIVWTLDHPAWQKLRPRLTSAASSAATALARGDLSATVRSLTTYLAVLDGASAEFAPRFALHVDILRIREAITAIDRALPPHSNTAARGQACADLQASDTFTSLSRSPDIEQLARAAATCKTRLAAKPPR